MPVISKAIDKGQVINMLLLFIIMIKMPNMPPQPMACILILEKILAINATAVVRKTPVIKTASTGVNSGLKLKNTRAIQK